METKLIITPDDSMWWILRPEFVTFIDKIIISKEQFEEEERSKNKSGYHKVTWDRLNVLLDNNILEIKDIKIDNDKLNSLTNTTIKNIFNKNNPKLSVVADTIFAYEYWIDFNKQKLDLVPNDQDYHTDISQSMPTWLNDMELLKKEGLKAFKIKPGIKEFTLKNIIKKVHQIKIINETYNECPLTALKEYEPFLKYIDSNINSPFITERTAFTYKNKIPSKLDGSVHLPIEPEYDFMRFNLSKIKFQNILKTLIDNYKEARNKIKELQKHSEEISFGLSQGKFNHKVTEDFININRYLLDNHRKVRSHSKYLSYCFFGLSLIPIPPVTALFGFLGLKSKKIAEYFESASFYFKGISPKGLSTYYSFNESLMDISKLNKFPDVQKDNNDFLYDKEKFWRI